MSEKPSVQERAFRSLGNRKVSSGNPPVEGILLILLTVVLLALCGQEMGKDVYGQGILFFAGMWGGGGLRFGQTRGTMREDHFEARKECD